MKAIPDATPQMMRNLVFAVAAILLAISFLAPPRTASASTLFTVNSNGDSADASTADNLCDTDLNSAGDQCTLRAAIEQSNATSGPDTINFGFPGTGIQSIAPATALPTIQDQVVINGYSQSGATVNTLEKGTNASLRVELTGTNAGAPINGLQVGEGGSYSVIKGLAINRFGGSRGIGFVGNNVNGVRIEGNFIGTDFAGTVDLGNSGDGIGLGTNSGVTIGGALPGQRNIISGNGGCGVAIYGFGVATKNKIVGNLIGTERTGSGDLGNDHDGACVSFGATHTSLRSNTVAFNGGDGVKISEAESTGNTVLSNSIFSNQGLGIDLGADGKTANDVGDTDKGPNNLQNFPVLSSAKKSSTGKTTIKGNLNGTKNHAFKVQFFSNPGGTDEGKRLLFSHTVSTDGTGNGSFTLATMQKVRLGNNVTATATDISTGDTSEFSAPRMVVKG